MIQNGGVKLCLQDNGIGSRKIIESDGLRGIRKRIGALGGEVGFDTFEEDGFTIKATIPLSGEEPGID
jgi:signal transduction histidine kinase